MLGEKAAERKALRASFLSWLKKPRPTKIYVFGGDRSVGWEGK
jgi:hypothetical protein